MDNETFQIWKINWNAGIFTGFRMTLSTLSLLWSHARCGWRNPIKQVWEANVKQAMQRATYLRSAKGMNSLIAKKTWLWVVCLEMRRVTCGEKPRKGKELQTQVEILCYGDSHLHPGCIGLTTDSGCGRGAEQQMRHQRVKECSGFRDASRRGRDQQYPVNNICSHPEMP